MPSASVLGLQWGDEGKGKVLDVLAGRADMVVRFQGGGNAGHTVIVEGTKYVLHTVPTGVLHEQVTCVIGNGVVVDVVALTAELEGLVEQGVGASRVKISDRAQVVLPYHKALDEAREAAWNRGGSGGIGTTKRGIGPCYADKAARMGVRIADLYDPGKFQLRLERALAEKNALLQHLGAEPLELEAIRESTLAAARKLEPHVVDAGALVQGALAGGRRVLFEGAQGVMLDVDHGTYPFVTSSSSSAAGIACGAGVPPAAGGKVLGVAKAYTTRVGAGPFPTEIEGPDEERLRQMGREFGATTGRPRRCGWLDVAQLRYAVRLCGVDGIVLTKLDTLAGFGPLQVGVGYERHGAACGPPADESGWDDLTLVTDDMAAIPAGADFSVTRFEELPSEARDYVHFVEREVGVPVVAVSTGPARRDLIPRDGFEVFAA